MTATLRLLIIADVGGAERRHIGDEAMLEANLDAFRWGTEGSANCLGRKDIGKIAVGKQADMAFYTLDELRFSGAGDPLAALVLCGAYKADRVMVKGDWRIEDSVPPGMDLAELRYEHGRVAKKFLEAV